MSNKDFDRVVINPLERPLSMDINRAQSQSDRTLKDLVRSMMAAKASINSDASTYITGFIGDGFKVRATAPAALNVVITAGMGFINDTLDVPSSIGGIVGLDDLSPYKSLFLSANETIAVPAADAVNPRIDIVEVQVERRLTDSSSRDILDPGTRTFVPTAVDKTLTFDCSGQSTVNGAGPINYKTGTPGAAPSAPAVSAGYVKIAEIAVPALDTTISTGQIADRRRTLGTGGMRSASLRWSIQTTGVMPVIPTLIESTAPPGVRVVISALDPIGAQAVIYVLAGDITMFHAITTPQDNPGANIIFTTNSYNTFVDTVNTARAAAMNDLTISFPDVGGVVGSTAPFGNLIHYVGQTILRTHRQAAGVTNTTLPDPMTFNTIIYFA